MQKSRIIGLGALVAKRCLVLPRLASLVLLLAANVSFAQVATYTSTTGVLTIPQLLLDGKTQYNSVNLSLPAQGAWSILNASNGPPAVSANTYPLHTSIPNYPSTGLNNAIATFTLANGQLWTNCNFGNNVYSGGLTNPNVTISALTNGTFLLQVDGTTFTCNATPFSQVTTSGGSSGVSSSTTAKPLVISPTSLSELKTSFMAFNYISDRTILITGGVPPYKATSSNQNVAVVSGVTSDSTRFTGLATITLKYFAGQSTIVITDSAVAQASATITIQ